MADIAPLVEEYRPDAVLINCSRPEAVTQGLPILASLGVAFGAYANAGHPDEQVGWVSHPQAPRNYLGFARQWVEAGASIVGGCCGTGPAHIRALSGLLDG